MIYLLILRPKKESPILENFLNLISLYEKKMVCIIDDQKKLDDFNYFIVFLYHTSNSLKGRTLFSRLINKKIGNLYMSDFIFDRDDTTTKLCINPVYSYTMNENTYIELNISTGLYTISDDKMGLKFYISSKVKEFDNTGREGSINLAIDNKKYASNIRNISEFLECS